MRRTLAVAAALFATACSLVFGLYGNEGPLSSPGCPPDAGTHAFCEFFDETPSWPADAQMPEIQGAPVVLGADAGCPSPPHCLSATGDNYVERTIATPNGVHRATYAFLARFDLVDSGVVPRVAWIQLDTGGGQVTFGVTFAHDTATSDYEVFVFGDPSAQNSYMNVVPVTLDVWYDLVLTVDLDASTVELTSAAPQSGDIKRDYVAEWAMQPVAPTSVTQIVVGGGVDTGMAHTAATLDSITFDWN